MMTQAQIAAQLNKLAHEMITVAAHMDYYGGFAEWALHSRELVGAARIAYQWADEIEAALDD